MERGIAAQLDVAEPLLQDGGRGHREAQRDDTGRVGPTWFVDHKACIIENGCENHPDNQFLSFAYKKGFFEACGHNGVCGSISID